MKKHIPNLLTILNLLAGTAGIYLVIQGEAEAALWILIACLVLDFMDGLTARLLNSASDFGKELDSLADVISFGLFSTALVFTVVLKMELPDPSVSIGSLTFFEKAMIFSVLLVPAFSAIRLARFNLRKQSDIFLGLPVPAFAMFWAGIYFDIQFNGTIFNHTPGSMFIWTIMVVTSVLMITPVPMISLKFRNFSFKENIYRYILLILSCIILIFTGVPGLSLVILTYILVSLVRIILT